MNKLLEILKRKLCVNKITIKSEEIYMLDVCSNQLTEEEYDLIREFIQKKEKENEQI